MEAGGLNLYGFCLNNPINRWDFLGMNSLLSGLMQSQALMESSISDLEAELSKLQASGQDDQLTDGAIQRLSSDLDLKRTELYSVLDQIYQIQSAPNTLTQIIGFYSEQTDSFTSLAPGALSTTSLSDRHWSQAVVTAELLDDTARIGGIVVLGTGGALVVVYGGAAIAAGTELSPLTKYLLYKAIEIVGDASLPQDRFPPEAPRDPPAIEWPSIPPNPPTGPGNPG